MNSETKIVRRASKDNPRFVTAYDWTIEGDLARKNCDYYSALECYSIALNRASVEQKKYLVPRIMSCYRRTNNSKKARAFFGFMKEKYGVVVFDHVSYTVLASVYGDLKEWDAALQCADQACILNDGEINGYLDAVYGRINYNVNSSNQDKYFA